MGAIASLCLASAGVSLSVAAATMAPPMLDITRQCDANTRHNATAMSECVVAESEARAELLQLWDKLSDASAGKCIKIGKKARKLPYSAMVKCLTMEPVEVRAPQSGAPTASGVPTIAPGATPAPTGTAPTNTPSKWPYFSLPHFGVP